MVYYFFLRLSIPSVRYEGVALVIESCVTYGTVMGEITFNQKQNEIVFNMLFQKVHEDAPEAHRTTLSFDWDTDTGAINEKQQLWTGECVAAGNAFHIKNVEGIMRLGGGTPTEWVHSKTLSPA